jgi:hypothetical protein
VEDQRRRERPSAREWLKELGIRSPSRCGFTREIRDHLRPWTFHLG